MRNMVKWMPIMVVFGILASCGGGSDDPTTDTKEEEKVVEDPRAATLVFPLKDATCNQGTVVSNTLSDLEFEWNTAEFATSYTVVLKNLDTDVSENIISDTNKQVIRIARGTPYSWYIVSNAAGTEKTAESEIWKFYMAGPGLVNYAPFPADAVSPEIGATVGTTTTLEWNVSDVDGDNLEYEVYLDTENPPATLLEVVQTPSLSASLDSGTVYYWRVLTKDESGNSSTSAVFDFQTQ